MIALRPIRALLTAIFLAMAGSGFLATLVALNLSAMGATATTIGLVGSAYFAGLAVGSAVAGQVIRRVGHIRAFAAFVSLFSASMLAYALHQQPLFWGGLRVLDGLCMAGIFVCLESWLNDRAPAEGRGTILAVYMIALYVGQAIGQPLLTLGDGATLLPLAAGSMLLSLSVLPVALTRMPPPALPDGGTLALKDLYAASPLGVAGALATGMVLGAFYALGGLFTAGVGLDMAQTSRFMGIAILGGVALQWPLGLLSDRYDRRTVIIGALIAALALSPLLLIAALAAPGLLPFLVAPFGGVAFALYPLFAAHANDRLGPSQRVGAAGRLVLIYSVGAVLGPMLGAATMDVTGPAGLFGFLAAVTAAILAFALRRSRLTSPVPMADQGPYRPLPRTTPVTAAFDAPAVADAATDRPESPSPTGQADTQTGAEPARPNCG